MIQKLVKFLRYMINQQVELIAVSMQHDVDYSVCGNKPKSDQIKCKNEADRQMVKALDSIPWKERQWGHTVARNAIAAKAKLGLGLKKTRKVKKTSKAVE